MASIGDILAMIVDDKCSSSDISESDNSNWFYDSSDSSRYHRYRHGCSSCGYCSSCYDKYGCNIDSFEMRGGIVNQEEEEEKEKEEEEEEEEPTEIQTQGVKDENYWNTFFSTSIKRWRNFYLKRNAKKMRNGKIVLEKAKLRRKSKWKKDKNQISKRKRREKGKKVDYLNGWY